jgi:hypothetical protein
VRRGYSRGGAEQLHFVDPELHADVVLRAGFARPCQECGVELTADSPDLRLELTDDGEPVVFLLGVAGGTVRRRKS